MIYLDPNYSCRSKFCPRPFYPRLCYPACPYYSNLFLLQLAPWNLVQQRHQHQQPFSFALQAIFYSQPASYQFAYLHSSQFATASAPDNQQQFIRAHAYLIQQDNINQTRVMQQKDNIGKIIDKYRIQSILESKPNGITIMRAINATTNEPFIIKKAPITKNRNEESGVTTHSQQAYQVPTESQLLYAEVNNIKDMSIPRVLKCLQMIKTKRSLYMVYQNYPELNLEKYLKERGPAPALRIRFAKIICQLVQEIHKKQYLHVNLTPASIYVISGSNLNPSSYQLRFVGFEYARKLRTGEQSVEVDMEQYRESPYLAPEVLETNQASIQSDIYSVGKIFQLLGLAQIKGKTDNKLANQTIMEMIEPQPKKRSTLAKVWECIKLKESQGRIFDHKVLELHITRNKLETGSISQEKVGTAKIQLEKRNIEEEQKRLKKILKIRSLVIYLHDLANFSLKERNRILFYLLLKKSVIVRANLVHEIKKMLTLYTGEHYTQLNVVKDTLINQQNQSLNLLSKTEENLKAESYPISIAVQLENRNELNQQLMQDTIYEFIIKKKKEIKPFHSILDENERNKLINLCGLGQKFAYGSFQKFFDEVVDDSQAQISKQKYFGYLKSASTKQIFDRLDNILKTKSKQK